MRSSSERGWWWVAGLWLTGIALGSAAAAETAQPAVETITVTATRRQRDILEVPAAVSAIETQSIQEARRQLSLGEALASVPGVFTQNRNNFAQDLRVSIRGFGARASFGIRGIKLVIDGIPATLSDGQGQLDTVDLSSAGRIEVVRGPSATLYGSAAGGVIRIETEDAPERPFAQLRSNFGSHGFRSYAGKAGGQIGSASYLLSLSRQELSGYRDHSRMQNLLFNSKWRYHFDENTDLTLLVNHLHAPTADDPGGLRASEVAADRRQASARNELFDAGEALDQTSLGARFRTSFAPGHESSARAYAVWRDFQNKLPFRDGGSVSFGRMLAGGSLEHQFSTEWFGRPVRWLGGFEVDTQQDQRRRRLNEQGVIGALSLEQTEQVSSLRAFLQGQFSLRSDLELTLGLGFDRVAYRVTDRFGSDGDDSGAFDLSEWSPSAALRYSPRRAFNLYARVATSFEPPTTTELANPSGAGGFNRGLDPQRALGYEIGAKGIIAGSLRYELAVFHIRLRDELIPFEIPSMPGRSFFANSGRSRRTGLETAVAWELKPGWLASLSYTYSDFKITTSEFAGRRLPGVPEQRVFAELSYHHPSGFFAIWDVSYVGKVQADSANTVHSDSFVVSNLRLGAQLTRGDWKFSPFVGVDNLFDEKYTDNLRLNARFGRSFEPAARWTVHGGASLRYQF